MIRSQWIVTAAVVTYPTAIVRNSSNADLRVGLGVGVDF
jgi:hypothetical protein